MKLLVDMNLSVSGTIAFDEKGAPGTQTPGLYPWFEVPGQIKRELRVVTGHWSTLGLFMGLGVYGIDTGCVWGGPLTALELGPEPRVIQVPGMLRRGPAQASMTAVNAVLTRVS